MCRLAKVGGYIIFTCDFKEGFKAGDPKPDCDYRFYTTEYLRTLVAATKNCIFVDEPNWSCANPDFAWAGFNYSFAAVVLQKSRSD